ncbi:Bug family tripartite tricarboxylate transporter substrate binding protein [Candidimonas nitroreducens]|uniref:ABC transporter substrate-binding protein n=1 Tax=Candidimonas nitroreducens TaxID=683354 RepID=A0A225M0L2_9BURK|nr:tripartite tricarboxylate transporter substrate binding protein [Candidimonas nitroreducens]OWT53753.1 hypothetical protein CEY11_23835 [Candidimonas nitroreducens]
MTSVTQTTKALAPVDRNRRRLLQYTCGAAAVLALPSGAYADDYPSRPVRLVVPFPAGGSSDTAARIVAKGLTQTLKQSFVVENRSGAAGTIGVASVIRASHDGYTLGEGPVGATIIAKLIGLPVPYNPVKDIVPIANMGSLPLVFAVKGSLPVKTLADLVALAKSKPGKLSYGTSGAGTPGHLVFEYFKKLTGIDVTHVPYKGDAPLTTDLLGGQLEIGILTGPAAVAQAKGGKLKYLAVTSQARYPQLPDIPTLIESGYHDFSIEIWNLLIAPPGTPEKILEILNSAANKVLEQEDTKAALRAQGYLPPTPMSPAQVKQFVARDRALWETIVKTTGVHIGS